MAFEGLGDKEGISGMSFHADVECLQASAEDPGVEGREGGAGAAAEEIDLFDQLLFPYDGSAEYATLAVDPFGGGVDNEIGAVLNRRLSDRGSEAIVYVENKVVFAGQLAGGFEVDYIKSGIGGRFQVNHLCIGPDSGFPACRVGGVDIGIVDAVFGKIFGDDGMGAAKDGIAGEQVIPFF